MLFDEDFALFDEFHSKPDDATQTESTHILSDDHQTNQFLNDILGRLRRFSELQTSRLTELTKIGVALSATRNLSQLLEMIVDRARDFTSADGGTLYLVDDDETKLNFSIVQTESLGFRMGGLTGGEVTIPPIPLKYGKEANNNNVCAYVANTGESVNIPDVYEVEGFDFSGARRFDEFYKYRSKSQLVVPLKDHQDEIIGVLQLINARDPFSGDTAPFPKEVELLVEALASQAAVALTNVKLIHDLQNLFESFIKMIASAIDAKSPYTGGHIERVSHLTMDIANRINNTKSGKYADAKFNEDEMIELRLAAWLHDTGKITTPEHVVDKKTKLETIFDREELVRLRFELAIQNAKKGTYCLDKYSDNLALDRDEVQRMKQQIAEEIETLQKDYVFVMSKNLTGEFLPDDAIAHLQDIAHRVIETSTGKERMLNDNELYNLSIRKGNLTSEERNVIENHVVMTYKLLIQLPFPKKMKNVSFIAGSHHEKLNGKGYPNGLTAEQIPLQVRIMTLADIFEALTANDRPYMAEAKKLSLVLKILGFMVKDGELDPDLVEFFLAENMHMEYAAKHLKDAQIDI